MAVVEDECFCSGRVIENVRGASAGTQTTVELNVADIVDESPGEGAQGAADVKRTGARRTFQLT